MFTTTEVIRAYLEDAEAVMCDKSNSSRCHIKKRDLVCAQMLRTLPEGMGIACAGTAIDPAKLNAGYLGEAILAYHYAGCPEATKVIYPSGGTYDLFTREGEAIEVKVSISGSCFNTKMKRPARVWLINAEGVYDVPEATAWLITMTRTAGKFPNTHEGIMAYEGVTRLEALSVALGFTAR